MTLTTKCYLCGGKTIHDTDIICVDCGAVWHYCVGDNCPYEVSSE